MNIISVPCTVPEDRELDRTDEDFKWHTFIAGPQARETYSFEAVLPVAWPLVAG